MMLTGKGLTDLEREKFKRLRGEELDLALEAAKSEQDRKVVARTKKYYQINTVRNGNIIVRGLDGVAFFLERSFTDRAAMYRWIPSKKYGAYYVSDVDNDRSFLEVPACDIPVWIYEWAGNEYTSIAEIKRAAVVGYGRVAKIIEAGGGMLNGHYLSRKNIGANKCT